MHTIVKIFRVSSPALETLITQMEEPLNAWLQAHAPSDAIIAPQTQMFYLQDSYHLIVTLTLQVKPEAVEHVRMGFQVAS